MIKEMKARGHQTFLAMPSSEDRTYLNLISPHCDRVFFINWTPWSRFRSPNFFTRLKHHLYQIYLSGGHFWVWYKLVRIIQKNEIELVHTNNSAVVHGAYAAKSCRAPHFWHIRELFNEAKNAIVEYKYFNRPNKVRSIFSGLSNRIIVNSKFTYTAHKQYFDERKVEVVYNGLEEQWFSNQEKDLKKPYKIGVVGNLTSKVKNHEFALEVVKELGDKYDDQFNVHLFGYIPLDSDPYMKYLKNKIEQYGIEGQVVFHGNVPAKDIYSDIDILLHPSKVETFGRIYVEAMAQGVPVVAYNDGAAPEVINDGVSGYLVVDPKKASEAIHTLCTSKENYQTMATQAFEEARQRFSLTGQMDKLESLYKQAFDE